MWLESEVLDMTAQKMIFYGLLIFALIALIFFIGYRRNTMRSKESIINFSQLTEHENFEDITLTIYYLNPFALTYAPLSVEGLMNGGYEHRIVIGSSDLMLYIDLFIQIGDIELISVEQESPVNARLYYKFENNLKNETFSVAMWGRNDSMFVNGLEVEEESIFYDVIMPFLPEHIAQELQAWIDRN